MRDVPLVEFLEEFLSPRVWFLFFYFFYLSLPFGFDLVSEKIAFEFLFIYFKVFSKKNLISNLHFNFIIIICFSNNDVEQEMSRLIFLFFI